MNETMPNGGDTPNGAESTDEFDYESLLKEHDEGTKPKPTAETPRTDPAVRELAKEFAPIAKFAQQRLQEEAANEERQIVEQAVSLVKEDGNLSNISDEIVEGYLNLQYMKNADFKNAFDKRMESPKAWNAALVQARESLTGLIKVTTSDKDDTEAALAAVKGTTQTEIEASQEIKPKELFAMSDHDFAEFKRNLDS